MQKGITPVIAIILLMLIIISIVTLSFMWFARVTETIGETGGKETESVMGQIGTDFKIENVFENNVYIRNTGIPELTDITFYVNNIKVDYIEGSLPIQPDKIGKFILDLSDVYEPTKLKVVSGVIKREKDIVYPMTDEGVCQSAEDNGLCDGLDITYGAGYTEGCCSEHGLCC